MGCLAPALATVGALHLWRVRGVGPVLAVVWVAGCFLVSRVVRSAPALVHSAQSDVLVEPQAVRIAGPRGGTKEHVRPLPTGPGSIGALHVPDVVTLDEDGDGPAVVGVASDLQPTHPHTSRLQSNQTLGSGYGKTQPGHRPGR